MAKRIFVDTAPLRHSREFRLLFLGFLVSNLGNQLTLVAIPFQIYHATHSSFQVGLISAAQLAPLIIGSLMGGALGDQYDRRSLMLATAVLLATTSAILALNAGLWHTNLVVLYLVSMLAAFFAGISNPQRSAVIPKLVAREHLVAAMSFNQLVLQFGGVVGPALAGLIIAVFGVPTTYAIDALTFAITIVTTALLASIPPAPGAAMPMVASIRQGFGYLRGRSILQAVYLIDLNAMIFGMPRAVFPAMAATVYHVGPSLLGLLYAAPAVGALLGVVTTGWASRVVRRGMTVSIAVSIWGLSIAAFGLVHLLVLGLIFLGIAGWADVVSAVLRNTMLQTSIPDQFRSRLSAIQIAVVQGGPKLGDLETGAVAGLTTPQFSVVSGGLACVVGVGLLAFLRPGFWAERDPQGTAR